MKYRIAAVIIAVLFAGVMFGCKEKAGEAKKEEAKKEAPKAADEAVKKAKEEAKKAGDEAAKQIEAAKAEAEKAKEEAGRALEEAGKVKAEAEEDMAKTEEKALRDALTKDLAAVTADFATLKGALTTAKKAWEGDDAKTAAIAELLAELEALETERDAVEGLMVQGKLPEGQTKLEVLKAKFPPVNDKAQPILSEKAIPAEKWDAMLRILASEACLMKKNLPVQEFQKEREGVFQKYAMDRVEYEQLRALYNKAPKPADQGKLGQLVAEFCGAQAIPEGEVKEGEVKEGEVKEGEVKEGEVKEGEVKEGEVKAEKKPSGVSGTFSGTLSGAGKKGTIKFIVADGKLKHGVAVIGQSKITLKGAFGGSLALNGKASGGHIRCKGKVGASKITGTCNGTYQTKRFTNAKFTALKKK